MSISNRRLTIGGQVGFRVGGVAWVLGDGWQGPQPRENEVEDGQGVIAAIAAKVLDIITI